MNDSYKELTNQDKYGRVRLEKFFCSGWFDVLSDCDGRVLMQMIRRKWHECKRVS